MRPFPKIIILSSLLILAAPIIQAEPNNSYIDALSSEAGDTKMKASETATVEDDVEPAVVPDGSVDTDALATKVGNQLEKILSGGSADNVKKEDLANIVSDAVKEGHTIDAIHDAVGEAMAELQKKEGTNIKPEVLKFASDAVNDIVGASKDIAQGNPDDPYIQSLNAEINDTSLDTKDTKEEKTTTSTSSEKNSEIASKQDKAEDDVANSDKSSETTGKEEKTAEVDSKPNPSDVATSKSDETTTEADTKQADDAKTDSNKMKTIVVLKGESLSKIAAKIYGSARKYTILYEANKDSLKNPNSIAIGQVLKVPPLPASE